MLQVIEPSPLCRRCHRANRRAPPAGATSQSEGGVDGRLNPERMIRGPVTVVGPSGEFFGETTVHCRRIYTTWRYRILHSQPVADAGVARPQRKPPVLGPAQPASRRDGASPGSTCVDNRSDGHAVFRRRTLFCWLVTVWSKFSSMTSSFSPKMPPASLLWSLRRIAGSSKRRPFIYVTAYRPSEIWSPARPAASTLNIFDSIVVQTSGFC